MVMIYMQSTAMITKTLLRIENSYPDEVYGEKVVLVTLKASLIPTARIGIIIIGIPD